MLDSGGEFGGTHQSHVGNVMELPVVNHREISMYLLKTSCVFLEDLIAIKE